MKTLNWESIPVEQMNPAITRQAIHTANMTLARIHLLKGAVVIEHRHINEQISFLQQGKLCFKVAGEELILEAGDILEIPPNAPHTVAVLEESVVIDTFAPPREDWIRGDDAYLRK